MVKMSRENAEYQIIKSLVGNRKKRRLHESVYIEGTESIKQALTAGVRLTRIIYPAARHLSDWARGVIVDAAGARVIEMDAMLYTGLVEREGSEIVVTAEYRPRSVADVTLGNASRVVVFDRPSDKGNLGTLIRSCNAFGVDAVLLIGHGVDPTDPKVIRTSLGAVFHTPVVQVASYQELSAWIEEAKELAEVSVIGTDSDSPKPLAELSVDGCVVLVLGNEAKGLSVKMQSLCDEMVSIPMVGQVNSLNVACAGTVALWHLSKG